MFSSIAKSNKQAFADVCAFVDATQKGGSVHSHEIASYLNLGQDILSNVPPITCSVGVKPSAHMIEGILDFAHACLSIENGLPIELLFVAHNFRRLTLLHGPESNVIAWADWARTHGLTAWQGPHEFTPVPIAEQGGFANQNQQISWNSKGSGRWRGLLVGQEPQLVALAWVALQFGWDSCLGTLLGYPACCVKKFTTRWPLSLQEGTGDPGILMMEEANYPNPLPWRLNFHARLLGQSLIDWFPCRVDCNCSLERASYLEVGLALLIPEELPKIEARMRTSVEYIQGKATIFTPLDSEGNKAGSPIVLSGNDLKLSSKLYCSSSLARPTWSVSYSDGPPTLGAFPNEILSSSYM